MTRRKFKCPYCFELISDDEVHFRSNRIDSEEFAWPDDGNFYEGPSDFKQNYQGADKEEYLRRYFEWDFFHPRPDAKYEAFWNRYDGDKTEQNLADTLMGSPAYYRRVIDPNNVGDRKFLRQRPGTQGENVEDYLIRDEDGMVAEVELKSGGLCDRRVCPHCHNPLPTDYGKYRIRFITVIGSVSSGKTVFLSQLINRMGTYSARNGLDAHVRAEGTLTFQRNYRVRIGQPLPGATFGRTFQQPLVYEMVRREGDSQLLDTVVLYDVSGENFLKGPEVVRAFAPFVLHADGVIVLMDPMQIGKFAEQEPPAADEELIRPEEMLNSIYKVVSRENQRGLQSSVFAGKRSLCKTPFAICLSKSDLPCVQKVLDPDLYHRLETDMAGELDSDGYYRPVFDAKGYNPILDGLDAFFKKSEDTLALSNTLHTNYLTYTFFAFTALGCPAEERLWEEDGKTYSFPVGPRISPKRIEEPLLWLFHEMGYTGVNEGIHYPGRIKCPRCEWYLTIPLPKEPEPKTLWEKIVAWFRGLFHKKPKGNMKCTHCGYIWNYQRASRY